MSAANSLSKSARITASFSTSPGSTCFTQLCKNWPLSTHSPGARLPHADKARANISEPHRAVSGPTRPANQPRVAASAAKQQQTHGMCDLAADSPKNALGGETVQRNRTCSHGLQNEPVFVSRSCFSRSCIRNIAMVEVVRRLAFERIKSSRGAIGDSCAVCMITAHGRSQ